LSKHSNNCWPVTLRLLMGVSLFLFGVSRVSAEVEIDLSDQGTSTQPAAPTPTPVPAVQAAPAAAPTAVPAKAETSIEMTEEAEPTPTPIVAHGVLKMKDVYEAGIKAYKEKDYEEAIRYLKKSLTVQDPYTEKYYYAEANAMLGVIYQFKYPVHGHNGMAYRYYKAALKYESRNPTARKHIRSVYRYRNQ
jgi:tetratricopeptide (TPR) repeat protein